ncbi:MAG: flavodoxin family protein [Proteobacteria bacterium]|nr:flavodoxin family protein [Pseudomonadota bacterium]MBU1596496.1 flavodoxin family protein [Pseudomonadota bacterium]
MAELSGAVVVFACSHRAGGNSDAAAELVARGVREAGGQVRVVALRDYAVLACLACRACAKDRDSACVLREKDQAEELFAILLSAPAVVFVSPIYFYALPSLCKTWIDRSQRFWEARRKGDAWLLELPERQAFACLVAGQASGQKLFEGARLTLRYFLVNFGISLAEPVGLRGLDERGDLLADPLAVDRALALGREAWAAAQGRPA